VAAATAMVARVVTDTLPISAAPDHHGRERRADCRPHLKEANLHRRARVISRNLSHLQRARSRLEQLIAEEHGAKLLVSLYARDDLRLELPSDCLTLLDRPQLAVTRDVHPHSPLKARASGAS
jgi:hypothetical protein